MIVRQLGFKATLELLAFESVDPGVLEATSGSAIEKESLPQRPSIVITAASGGTLLDDESPDLSPGAEFPAGTACAWTDGRPNASEVNSMKTSHQ